MVSTEAKKWIFTAILLAFLTAFLAINFDNTLGLIYSIFITIIALVALWNKKIDFPLARKGKGAWEPIIVGVLSFAGFTLLSIFIFGLFSSVPLNIASIFSLLGSTIPALATSQIMTFISYGLFIPFVESVAFVLVFEAFSEQVLKAKFTGKRDFNVKTIFSMLLLALAFVGFHMTSKGVGNFLALGLVALMMIVTIVISIFQRELRAAIYFHILLNSTALAARFGLLSAAILSFSIV